MYINNYLIANLLFRLTTPFQPTEDAYTAAFRCSNDAQPDAECFVSVVDTLPPTPGRLVSDTGELRFFRDGDTLYQQLLRFRSDKVLAVSRYSVNSNEPTALNVSENDIHCITRTAHLWSGMDINFMLLRRGRVVLHSSSIVVNGKVILFSAPSGVGKSTQASLWNKFRGAQILNGDKNCVSFDPDSSQALAHGLPFCGTSGICTPYSLPLGAIVLLSQAKENSIRALRGVSALAALLPNCMGHKAIPETVVMMTDVLGKIIASVPVLKLECTPDENAVALLEKTITR